MTGEAGEGLTGFVARSLDRPVPAEIRELAERIARPGVAAVLFYGNMLRDPTAAGLADLYVLTDRDRAWSGTGPAALGNRLLPPNVYHLPASAAPPALPARAGKSGMAAGDPRLRGDGAASRADVVPAQAGTLGNTAGDPRLGGDDAVPGAGAPAMGAKVAVMRLAAFRHRMRRESWDTTLWARFAQPAALVWARDEAARAAVVEAVATGWRTAAWWADRLAEGSDRWAGLFARTYGAELRPEGAARPGSITAREPQLYAEIDRLLPRQAVPEAESAAARRAWAQRQRVGRALNAARLVKAASTFRGGAAYALDKITRHAGPDALRPWERRLPWLAAPFVLVRLLRRGRLR